MKNNQQPKPFLRWTGSKCKLAPQLKKLFPKKIRNYHEPFLGGGSVFLASGIYEKASLSDNLPDLINTFKVVRDSPEELIEKLKFHEHYDSESHFYFIRNLHDMVEERLARAASFIYLNATCFLGLYRKNSSGVFNNSYGKRMFRLQVKNLFACSERLEKAKIRQCDFSEIKVKRNDFVFLDPPPLEIDKSKKTEFGLNSHLRLKQFTEKLTRKGTQWMLVHPESPLIRELYKEEKIQKLKKTHSGTKDHILIRNY